VGLPGGGGALAFIEGSVSDFRGGFPHRSGYVVKIGTIQLPLNGFSSAAALFRRQCDGILKRGTLCARDNCHNTWHIGWDAHARVFDNETSLTSAFDFYPHAASGFYEAAGSQFQRVQLVGNAVNNDSRIIAVLEQLSAPDKFTRLIKVFMNKNACCLWVLWIGATKCHRR